MSKASLVNPILARWLQADVALRPPVDCDSCTLAGLRPQHQTRWRDYKCCTFQPFVANFLCGAMLEEGLDPLTIDPSKAILQPIGVVATAQFRELYENTDENLRGPAHLCSYYNPVERNCRIWKYRPGECSLFFCTQDKHEEKRLELTHQAFELESGVAQMALAHVGFSAVAIEAQVIELNDPDPGLGTISRKEAEEIYRACWKYVKTLTPEEISSWQGF